VHGAFTWQVVEAMTAVTDRPIIFPLSNPTSQIEAMLSAAIEGDDVGPGLRR
jgi:malic enzyme